MSEIDPRAVVSPSARIGANTRVGAYAVVGDEVELGEGCVVEHHAVVKGPAKFGRNNRFACFAVIGGDPQDLTYTGQRTTLEVGDDNDFREFATINRGTIKGGGVTRVGSHNLIMCYSHIGHDCQIGDNTIFIAGAELAGHTIVEDYATIGPNCLVHQFCRIGAHSYTAAGTVVTQDVPPYSLVVAPRDTKCYGINRVGLERHGFSPERIQTIEHAFRLLTRSKLNTAQAVEQMRSTMNGSPDVAHLIEFIERAERGIHK